MPLDTVLLLDTSGSMAGRGLRELKRACHTFLDGVEETATQTGLKENVAIVEFNSSARIVQSLTNDYSKCRRAVDSLNGRGTTAMFDGLMSALKEVVENGGVLRIAHIAMTPRIILMTDGRPTDTAGEEEAKKKVVAAALGFGPGWQECGLPHPVPIACVGCGDCDTGLLQLIAKMTKGMYVIVGNISELSTFFRRQVLLIRFAAQFASDLDRLRSQIALAAFMQELGEAVEQAEVAAMQQLLLAMLSMSVDDDDDDDDDGPPVGASAITPRLAIAPPSHNPTTSTSSALPTRRPSPPTASRPPGPSHVVVRQQAIVVQAAPRGPPATSSSTRYMSAPQRSTATSTSSAIVSARSTTSGRGQTSSVSRPAPQRSTATSTSSAVVPAHSNSTSGRGQATNSGSKCNIQ